MSRQCLTPLVVLSLLVLVASPAAAVEVIDYDASKRPDHSDLQTTFSTQLSGHAGWTSSGSELTVTSGGNVGDTAWFGNHPTHDLVPWSLGSSAEGNYVSVRAKLTPGSREWSIYVHDGAHAAGFWFESDTSLTFSHDSPSPVNWPSLTLTEYHTYTFQLQAGQVTYKIDGAEIYSGPAAVSTVIPKQYLVFGDGSYTDPTGYGSMIIDHLTVITPEPTVLALLVTGLCLRSRRRPVR